MNIRVGNYKQKVENPSGKLPEFSPNDVTYIVKAQQQLYDFAISDLT